MRESLSLNAASAGATHVVMVYYTILMSSHQATQNHAQFFFGKGTDEISAVCRLKGVPSFLPDHV